tara:strand:+ start:10092 stop:10394 length:303 start_codon:yes stop_codon:yes gene_type:complete
METSNKRNLKENINNSNKKLKNSKVELNKINIYKFLDDNKNIKIYQLLNDNLVIDVLEKVFIMTYEIQEENKYLTDNNLIKCKECGNIWDGNAQCNCWIW